jgi:hypothetical protein
MARRREVKNVESKRVALCHFAKDFQRIRCRIKVGHVPESGVPFANSG